MTKNAAINTMNYVIDVIDTLSMSTCSNTRASSLSGGERKRLCIAVELINNPPILFFDEPTSGLDSQTCFQLLSLLSALAAAGRTVICTIHQPSMKILELFQHLVVLADGRCIYRGGVPQLISYMAQKGLCCPPYHNPADFIMETLLGADKGLLDRLVMGVNNGKSEEWDSVLVQGAQTPSFTANQKSQSAYKISFEEKTQDTPQGKAIP
ncbi:unnamed protein product [Notodromas monacha]|uniref:ATP-binding cassette sub-family G member 1 n=1 Tax=Notodromas monacha TaxID=399045 RepID=A0A7R9BCB8_9CRUS|nr:unnamed protein product [Notodromas monacha]CAG0912253.1 unnamed protein product [Notodromas monacha]